MRRSYRIRGSVPRAHRKANAMTVVPTVRRMSLYRDLVPIIINKQLVNSLIIMIFIYSAIKIRANVPLLYSVLKPETSSDSPSAKSNGVRFVSARAVMNQINIRSGISIRIGIVWVE